MLISYGFTGVMLRDKIACVTGGGTGIGRAIGLQMAKNRAKVALVSRNRSHLASAAAEYETLKLPVLPIPMDVRKKQDVERAVDTIVSQWGAIHILVNNAGISGLSLIDDPDDLRWLNIVDTNLNGMYLVTKAVLKHMPDHQGGRVINISSVLGKFGVPGYTAYCTTKHGMIGFTRALALEVVNRGITVNTICPGWVETEMAAQGINETANFKRITAQEFKAQAIADIPIKRFLEADEVAELVCFLASNRAQGITGQAINICGGQTMV